MRRISISTASGQLAQIVEQAQTGHEAVLLTEQGRPKAVLLALEDFLQLLGAKVPVEWLPLELFQQQFQQALKEAGYRSREDLIELVQDVKREIAAETFPGKAQ